MERRHFLLFHSCQLESTLLKINQNNCPFQPVQGNNSSYQSDILTNVLTKCQVRFQE